MSVTTIGNGDFNGCTGITSSITISDKVITISEHAFYGCTGMTALTIGSSVETIGISVFPVTAA